MTVLRAGSLPWLLRHDLRLAWRDFGGGFRRLGPRGLAALALAGAGVLHAAVWEIAGEVAAEAAEPATRAAAERGALPVAGFALLLLLAQTMNGATRMLYGRADLDLVLASPAPPRRLFAARGLAVAAGAFASAAIFVLPLADAAAAQGHPRLLALYPTLAGGALAAAALGLSATLALFRLVGPRRTRLVAQVLATLVGAGFMLSVQFGRLAPGFLPTGGLAGLAPLRAVLLLPTRAALGDGGALALWLALSAAAFAAAAFGLGPAFARAAGAAAGVGSGPPGGRRARAGSAAAFGRGPLAALRRKEWRVILRDPWIVSQVMLQVLYMLPLAAVLWSGSGEPALAVAPTAVVVAFQVASSLTWLGLSGEDAPDLIASAPVEGSALRRAKLQAVGALAAAVVAAPLLYLAAAAPGAALGAAALAACGLAAAVALQLWHGAPGRRSAFAARHRESKLMSLVEMAMSVLLGLGTFLAVAPSAWALVPLGLACALVFALRPRRGRALPRSGAVP